MAKRGRPPKYKKEYCQLLIKHMASGLSFESFCAEIDVDRDTTYAWCTKYKDFSDAKKRGREKLLSFYEKIGRSAMAGKIENFNATAFVWQTKNMINWRDKQDIEISGMPQTEHKSITVNISQMVKDPDLLEDLINIENKIKNTKFLPQ